MAHLAVIHPDGTSRRVPLPTGKGIVTIGADPDSDVRIAGNDIPALAAHIQCDGGTYTLHINRNKLNAAAEQSGQTIARGVKKHIFQDGDTFDIGTYQFSFSLENVTSKSANPVGSAGSANAVTSSESTAPTHKPEKPEKPEKIDDYKIDAYKRLLNFSRLLGAARDVEQLLTTLIDEIIAVTGATQGFLLLLQSGNTSGGNSAPRLTLARNNKGENIPNAVDHFSDSIVNKVIQSLKPSIVHNALDDQEFNSSLSVINLRLTSVMCVPLIAQGELLGVIYVGNNSVTSLFDEKRFEIMTIFSGQAALVVKSALQIEALTKETEGLRSELEKSRYGEIIGACDGMRSVFNKVDKVAKTDVNVLITGETGTGKELIAREIHRRSPRTKGPLVVVNCGAIPENLLESELFGHVKGAFTGAVQTRIGKFQSASQGTLFLDEIGEMPLHLQVKLLRAIQDKQVTKVGDNKPEDVDIRVVSATHRNLDEMVRAGTFREDLYYRLNVIQVHLPPLRERGEDVVVIANFLLQKYVKEMKRAIKGFTPKGINALRSYSWPGNVRQLENRIKRAMVLCDNQYISAEDLDITAEDIEDILPLSEALERFRRRYINESLDRHGGNRTQTARALGVDPRTVFRHLEAERGDKGSEKGDKNDKNDKDRF